MPRQLDEFGFADRIVEDLLGENLTTDEEVVAFANANNQSLQVIDGIGPASEQAIFAALEYPEKWVDQDIVPAESEHAPEDKERTYGPVKEYPVDAPRPWERERDTSTRRYRVELVPNSARLKTPPVEEFDAVDEAEAIAFCIDKHRIQQAYKYHRRVRLVK